MRTGILTGNGVLPPWKVIFSSPFCTPPFLSSVLPLFIPAEMSRVPLRPVPSAFVSLSLERTRSPIFLIAIAYAFAGDFNRGERRQEM